MLIIVIIILLLFVVYVGGMYKDTDNKICLTGINSVAVNSRMLIFEKSPLDIKKHIKPSRNFTSYMVDLDHYLSKNNKKAVLFVDSIFKRETKPSVLDVYINNLNKLPNLIIQYSHAKYSLLGDIVSSNEVKPFFDNYTKHFARFFEIMFFQKKNLKEKYVALLDDLQNKEGINYDEDGVLNKIFSFFLINLSHKYEKYQSSVSRELEDLSSSFIEKKLSDYIKTLNFNTFTPLGLIALSSDVYKFVRACKYLDKYLLFLSDSDDKNNIISLFNYVFDVDFVDRGKLHNHKNLFIKEEDLFFKNPTPCFFQTLNRTIYRDFNLVDKFIYNDKMIIFVKGIHNVNANDPNKFIYVYLKELDTRATKNYVFYFDFTLQNDQNSYEIETLKDTFSHIIFRDIKDAPFTAEQMDSLYYLEEKDIKLIMGCVLKNLSTSYEKIDSSKLF